MTEHGNKDDQERSVQDSGEMNRREALRKLAKFSAYTAPTVITLLASRPSMAQLSLSQCMIAQAMGFDDAAPGMGAIDPGEPQAMNDSTMDCQST